MSTQEKARRYFDGGLNCAESVSKAIIEDFVGASDAVPRMATPFGGGVASSYQELCGALTGGLLALGYMMGRNSAQESNDEVKAFALQIHSWFIETYDKTTCGYLRDMQESKESFPSCADIVEKMTEKLTHDLMQKGFRPIADI